MKGMYWVSWYDAEEDYRPLTDPPVDAVLGWWCSGSDANGRHTLVALVKADNEKKARQALRADWPETARSEFRFCDEVDATTWKPSNRFPLEPWMRRRITVAKRERARTGGGE